MAAIPITIVGIETRDDGTSGQVTIVGLASLTGFGVGGGPIIPPTKPPDEKPPGIWGGPIDPYPGHPLPEPPGKPPVPPPSIWPPGPGLDWPTHPIVIPPPVDPEQPPSIPPGTLVTWTPVWTPNRGWFVVGVPNVPHPAPSA